MWFAYSISMSTNVRFLVSGWKIEASHDKDLSSNEQPHDTSAPVQLIGIDEVWEHGGQHERGELLANEDEANGLGSGGLGGSFLCDGPAIAAYGGGVEHAPGDHKGQEGGDGGVVGFGCHGCACDDDGPDHKEGTASDEAFTTRDDIGETDGCDVGEELQGGRDGGQAESVGLSNQLEVVSLVGVGEVTTGEVLRLETKDCDQRARAVFLGEDGAPAGLADGGILCLLLVLLELGFDRVEAAFNIGVGSE